MKTPTFQLEPVSESFLESAPFRLAETFKASRSAAEVWAELTGPNPLSWCRLLKDITWTSAAPYGVGTTRTVRTLASLSVLHEEFFLWEEGRRKAFYVVESNGPLFESFAEDYLVEPTSDTTCDFTWTIAAKTKKFAAPTNAVNKMILGTLLSDTRKHFGGNPL